MHTIHYEISLNVGRDGVDTNKNNPPSRALAALLSSGKNHKAQTFCYLNNPEDSNPTNPKQWLGVFLHSVGDRIIFFPALNIPLEWVETSREGSDPERRSFYPDHFSVEPSRQRWHITAPGSEEHFSGGRTPQAGKDSFFWVGLSFQNQEAFLPLYKQTFVTHNSPKSDVTRRMKLLKELEKTTTQSQVNIEHREQSSYQPSFLHMCFIFSKPSAPKYNGHEFLLPTESPYLNSPLPNPISSLKIWKNRVPLSSTWDIQVITMLLPGTISLPFLFTSPASL